MYKWLYKDTLESGVMVLLEEVDDYYAEGYVDTPDDYNKVVDEDESDLESMSKDDLELYAKEVFNVDLDKRKSKANLIKEIKALEDK